MVLGQGDQCYSEQSSDSACLFLNFPQRTRPAPSLLQLVISGGLEERTALVPHHL